MLLASGLHPKFAVYQMPYLDISNSNVADPGIISRADASLIDLSQLPAGRCAEIVEISGSPSGVARLQELGFQSGRTVQMIRPGATCIVKLDQCKMCFRPCGACIRVRSL